MAVARRRRCFSEAVVAELRARLLPWAAEATAARGRFSIADAASELLDGSRNTEPIARIVHALESEGLIERFGRIGWRHTGVMPGRVTRRSGPRRWSPEALAEMKDRLRRWTRERSEMQGHFTTGDAMNDLGLSEGKASTMLAELCKADEIIRLPGALGYRHAEVLVVPRSGDVQPSRWTAEAMADLRERLVAYALEQTRLEGRFTVTAATEVLVGNRNTLPVRAVLQDLIDEGKVEFLSQRKGWRWSGIDAPEPRIEMGPLRWTPEARQQLREQLIAWGVEQTRVHGRFTIEAATPTLLDMSDKGPVSSLVHELVAEGRVVSLGSRLGWAFVDVVTQGENLAAVMQAAARCLRSADAKSPPPRKGRKSGADDRRVSELTKPQFEECRTAAGLIAEFMGDGDMAAITLAQLGGWDPSVGSSGDWAILKRVARWSDERSKAKAERAGNQWNKAGNDASRHSHVQGARRLLDLAASQEPCMIPRQPCHLGSYQVHAAEWQPHVEQWIKDLLKRNEGVGEVNIRLGVRTLALYATRRGELSPDAVDWRAVRKEIERDLRPKSPVGRKRSRATARYQAVRFVWRRTKHLQEKLPWLTTRDTRRGLVSRAAIVRVVKSKGEDWSLWNTADGAFMRGLVEGICGEPADERAESEAVAEPSDNAPAQGRFGLRRWALWATVEEDQLAALELPARAWPTPTDRQFAMMEAYERDEKELFRFRRPATFMERLERINILAGYAAEHEGFDPVAHAADRLVDADMVRRYVAWREREGEHPTLRHREPQFVRKGIDSVARAVHLLGSPYLQAEALRLGDADAAEQLHAASRRIKKIAYRWRKRGPGGGKNANKHIRRIAEAWSANGEEGWATLDTLVEHLIEEAQQIANMPLAETTEAIKRGTWTPSLEWAWRIRDACALNLLRKIPLRSETFAALEFRHLVNRRVWRDGERMLGDDESLQPWEGAIYLMIEAALMKSDRDFAPAYIAAAHVGNVEHERGARRDLLKAWFMAGGGRDRILVPAGGGAPLTSSFLFPATASKGAGPKGAHRDPGGRWQTASAQAWFVRVVSDNASVLRLDLAWLRQAWGGVSFHVVRLLFGTFWGDREPKAASEMLDHQDVAFTLNMYSGVSEATGGLELTAEDRQRSAQQPDAAGQAMGAQVELLTAQIGTMQTQLQLANEQQFAANRQIGELTAQLTDLLKENAALSRRLVGKV